ncbi:MAG: DUF5985 family protein [Phycisphaerales bacterium]
MNLWQAFFIGVNVMASAAIGLYFLRFWRGTRDPLFMVFAVGFWLLAANWGAQMWAPGDDYPQIYLLRLLAFGFIIAGIVGKNAAARRRHEPPRAG